VLMSSGDHPHAIRAAAVQTGTGPAAWCGCEMVDMMATVWRNHQSRDSPKKGVDDLNS